MSPPSSWGVWSGARGGGLCDGWLLLPLRYYAGQPFGVCASEGIWLNFNPSERLLKETKGVSVYKPMPSANRKQLGCWATQ